MSIPVFSTSLNIGASLFSIFENRWSELGGEFVAELGNSRSGEGVQPYISRTGSSSQPGSI